MIKKFAAILAAVTITCVSLASCADGHNSSSTTESAAASVTDASQITLPPVESQSGEGTASPEQQEQKIPEPSLTVDGNKIDISNSDLVMCTVDGVDIDFELFRYYFMYKLTTLYNNYGVDAAAIAASEDMNKAFLEEVMTSIKLDKATSKLAAENKIELTAEELKEVDDKIEETKKNYTSEDQFQNAMKSAYLTPEIYKNLLIQSKIYDKMYKTLFTNGGKYATSAEEFKKIVKDNDKYSRVIHILIPFYCKAELTDESVAAEYENYNLSQKGKAKQAAYNALSDEDKAKVKEEAKKVADEVLEKAKKGDDFAKLITEYGWDPGMEYSPEGYYIIKDNSSFIKEFTDKSFELKENEISDLVESSAYGWVIIKRLPVDMDYVEKNLDAMIEQYDKPALNKLYSDTIDSLKIEKSEYIDKLLATSIT